MLARITPVLMLALFVWPTSTLIANADRLDALFHIECPPDVTVDCDAEIWDLSGYGWAYVYGYGSPVPAGDPVVSYHLNSCGIGYVTRTWTAYDYQNYPHSCTQYIYVGAGGGFNEYNIHWPPNYMTPDCGAGLDPDDLPPPYDYPTYDDVECSMIMIGYEDLVFDFGGGCKKILRTWSVLDWCAYNPNYPYGGGRWEHTQVLKVKPNGGITLNCPDDVVASAGNNCSGTYVDIPPATGMGACGSSLQITNNSPYASSNGANASGYYPYGTTYVKFTVEDACGNWETCQMKVVVKDMKKPTPICYNGLTANLMVNHDGYYIDLEAEWFNKGSFDNCTPDYLLTYRIEPSRFTCDDLGPQNVKMYVTDSDGNTQYCNTYVIIQDNMGMCPPPDTTTFTLAGSLTNLQGLAVSGIELELSDQFDMVGSKVSDQNGTYDFSGVQNHMNYMVMPRGDNDYLLGLSTFDLLKLAKHIYGVKLIQSDGELLAADADQNGDVNVADLLVLRKLLLNYSNSLPNHKAWRFIPTDLLQSHPGEVLSMQFDEYWTKDDLYEDVMNIDFTVIKIGDINGSVQNVQSGQDRSSNQVFELDVVKSDTEIRFISTKRMSVSGLQMELNLTNSQITGTMPGVVALSNANVHSTDRNTLVSWFDAENEITIAEGDVLFTITTSEVVQTPIVANTIDPRLLPELYSFGEVIYDLQLNNLEQPKDSDLPDVSEQSVLVFPNPVGSESQVHVISSGETIENIHIYNSTGKMLLSQSDLLTNEANVSLNELVPGLYMLQIKLADGRIDVRKLVVQ